MSKPDTIEQAARLAYDTVASHADGESLVPDLIYHAVLKTHRVGNNRAVFDRAEYLDSQGDAEGADVVRSLAVQTPIPADINAGCTEDAAQRTGKMARDLVACQTSAPPDVAELMPEWIMAAYRAGKTQAQGHAEAALEVHRKNTGA